MALYALPKPKALKMHYARMQQLFQQGEDGSQAESFMLQSLCNLLTDGAQVAQSHAANKATKL